jgi:hypothetical protein
MSFPYNGINAIAIGTLAASTNQGISAVAIGLSAGQTNQGVTAVAIGSAAGLNYQGDDAVAIGNNAGQQLQKLRAVAVGSAGVLVQGQESVAVGYLAGYSYQGNISVAIGSRAGVNTQGAFAVAVGPSAGADSQRDYAVAIGSSAGASTQGTNAVAVGATAGNQSQGENAVAIGINAGERMQGISAVAIGNQAGLSNQGANAIAIGNGAGQTNQPLNSIVLNSSGITTNGAVASAVYIRPMRGIALSSTVSYNTSTFELSYLTSSAKTKNTINDLSVDTSDIYKLRPRTYLYNSDPECGFQTGYIAEEVADINPDYATYAEVDGDPVGINYNVIIVYLVEEMKTFKTDLSYVDTQYNLKVSKSGDKMSGTLDMSSNKIMNITNGSNPKDAVNFGQLDEKLNKSGGTMTGILDMNSNKIMNITNGSNPKDAVNFGQLDEKLNKSGGTMTGILDMNSNKIMNITNGSNPNDAVNFGQLDEKLNKSGGTITGTLTVNNNASENQLTINTGSGTNSRRANARFYSTFANNVGDTGSRRTADIIAGYNATAYVGTAAIGTWGSEYLSFNVGNNGGENGNESQGALTSEKVRITASGNVGIGTNNPLQRLHVNGDATITGRISKGSGSFKIDHPLKPETHHLVHSFIEGPRADLIYRGRVELVNGEAYVNIDESSGMSEGTFVALCRDIQCFVSNESNWDAVKGSVTGNQLHIMCQNTQSNATISWLVIGERQDKHMYDTDWTDENGRVIVEPLKSEIQE